MITSPHTMPSLAHPGRGAMPMPVPARERCPFLQHAGAMQAVPTQPIRPPASVWPTAADARAGEVLETYQRAGGLATGDEVTLLLRRRTSQPISMLARWIVERRVVSFGWRGEYLLPMFQFDRSDMAVSKPVGAVLDAFDGVFDDWDLATWFALPNAWLADRAPVDVLDRAPNAVLQAARTDRFVAHGFA